MNRISSSALCIVLAVACTVPVRAEKFADALARFQRAESAGFRWTAANTFPNAFAGKTAGVTNDGPMGAPLLGGIGTGVFGRDLQGHFNRWQLQPGFPRVTSVDAASLCLRWQQADTVGAYRVGDGGWDRGLPAGARTVAVLWPFTLEHVTAPQWPVDVVIESWSPVVPHDDKAAALPVAFFDVHVRNTSAAPASVDLALFLPNFLGWRKGFGFVSPTKSEQEATVESGGKLGPRAWLERSNSGNYAEPLASAADAGLLTGVLHRRAGYTAPTQDMEGEVLLGVAGPAGVRAQRTVEVFGSGRANGRAAAFFLEHAERGFFQSGRLPEQEKNWRSEANEVCASAVAGGVTLQPGAEGHFTLVVVWDMPLVEFGSGRTWEKAYTAQYGVDGRQAARIAKDALSRHDAWHKAIEEWQTGVLGGGSAAEQKRHGACLNDLSYIVSGGTSWVTKEHPKPGLEPALLGSGEHFSILEGCADSGYYFCTTFDLWPYAQPAFEATWPHLVDVVLADYTRTAAITIADPRVVTSAGTFTARKVANKIPHDLGCPAGDPWCQLNEYGSTRDSNVWKDHDPEFILSLYLHHKYNGGRAPDTVEWQALLGLASFMAAQDKQHDGLPYHDAQGDNTWDALHFTGPSPFSGALTLGAWAAMADWARQRGDAAAEKQFADRVALGQASFEKYFWNGRYYRAAANGEQAEWIMTDALFGILLAEAAGLHGLLPAEHITAHLRAAAARNWREFGGGRVGPSLLAPPSGKIPSSTQVGEVLVGSARAAVALMQRFGLAQDAAEMADAVNRTAYEDGGLQFRIPAAWTPEKTFRAPANLRPLASWYSLWPERKE